MKLKQIIMIFVFPCSMIALFALSNLVMASNEVSIDYSDSKPLSFEELKIEHEKLLQLKESTIQQRNEIIKQLTNIIKDPNSHYYAPFYYTAVEILGDIRAVEATDILLDIVVGQSNLQDMPITSGSSSSTKLDVSRLIQLYPPIGSIIKIRPSYISLIERLKNEDSAKERLYCAILLGTEGKDISQFIIEKAIQDETDTRKIKRLKAALSTVKESRPIKQGEVN